MATAFDIDVGVAGTVTGLHYRATPSRREPTTVVLAHGAGGSQLSPFMTTFSSTLSTRGIDVVTFNFVYMEGGRRAPDPKARLENCYGDAVDATRRVVPSARARLIIGGKSMGGRIASQVVAADASDLGVSGLVFLGYPLHPPGRPEKRRDAHLRTSGHRSYSFRVAATPSGPRLSFVRSSRRVSARHSTSSMAETTRSRFEGKTRRRSMRSTPLSKRPS